MDTNLTMFDVTYLTREVNIDPRAKSGVQTGLVCYQVYAKHVEDAILRLREQEPAQHPIIEIASVMVAPGTADGSPRMLDFLIAPREWLAGFGGRDPQNKTH